MLTKVKRNFPEVRPTLRWAIETHGVRWTCFRIHFYGTIVLQNEQKLLSMYVFFYNRAIEYWLWQSLCCWLPCLAQNVVGAAGPGRVPDNPLPECTQILPHPCKHTPISRTLLSSSLCRAITATAWKVAALSSGTARSVEGSQPPLLFQAQPLLPINAHWRKTNKWPPISSEQFAWWKRIAK